MAQAAITFDFHDTLVHCPEWFNLEVRTLVSDFVAWREATLGRPIPGITLAEVDTTYRALRLEIIEHGFELPAGECIRVTLERLGVAVDQADIDAGVSALMRETLSGAHPVEGAVDAVRAIAEAGVPLGIVSSAVYHPFLEWSLEQFGIIDCFDVITTSASSGFYKTRPEIYSVTLDHLRATPEVSVHVGDSFRFDVNGARAAGMQTVWLNAKGNSQIEGHEPADHTTLTLSGIAPKLLAMIGHVGS